MKRTVIQIIVLLISFTGFSQTEYPVSYTIPEKIEVKAGAAFAVPVSFKMDEPWYIYAPTGNNAAQGMIETNIIFQLPKGLTRKGKIQLPKSKYKGGFEVYEGKDIKMSQQFTVGKDVLPGEYIIKGKIKYQTCNDKICLPPNTDEISITVEVKNANNTNKDTNYTNENADKNANEAKEANSEQINLKFTALDGRKVDIEDLKGKLVLIDCWATWCRPCIEEFDNLKKLYQKYRSKGFEIIGISMDEATAKQRMSTLVKKYQLPWPQYFEGKGFDENSFKLAHNISALPAVFLLDKKGNIIDTDARGERLEDLIKENL